MKPLRQQNRPVISYVPRVEPAPPEHAIKMDAFRDVWILRGKYVAFVLMGEAFSTFARIYGPGISAALG
ncbi:Cell division activator cedA [Citrobacter freundii]|uniref:Cell division activator cedA n=1 Tax=Citrobacter freundii TaxID=546 RepID=A0A7G2IWK6_CITFR|nr:Cell division activator cedA [Citrobacter freundii]